MGPAPGASFPGPGAGGPGPAPGASFSGPGASFWGRGPGAGGQLLGPASLTSLPAWFLGTLAPPVSLSLSSSLSFPLSALYFNFGLNFHLER